MVKNFVIVILIVFATEVLNAQKCKIEVLWYLTTSSYSMSSKDSVIWLSKWVDLKLMKDSSISAADKNLVNDKNKDTRMYKNQSLHIVPKENVKLQAININAVSGYSSGWGKCATWNNANYEQNKTNITITPIDSTKEVYIVFAEATRAASISVDLELIEANNPKTIFLHKGWNWVGFPFEYSQKLETALSSIWENVEVVKSENSYYDKSNENKFNSLHQLDYGLGYLLKVSNDCELVWKNQN